MTDYCYPCLERTGKKVTASRCIAGTWMCARCAAGEDRPSVDLSHEIRKLALAVASIRRDLNRLVDELTSKAEPDDQDDRGDLAQRIIQAVKDEFNLPLHLLACPSKERRYIPARQAVIYLLREECGYSYVKIGAVLGKRDPKTIMHHLRYARTAGDPALASAIERVRRRVYGLPGAQQWQPQSQLSQ